MANIKLQASIDGYEGWALARMLKKTGWKNHDLCRTIVREWVMAQREELRKEYGISREQWELEVEGNVRRMEGRRPSKAPTDGGAK